MNDGVAIGILLFVCSVLFVWNIRVTADWHDAAKRLERLQFSNPHAHLLGRTVEARVYEASKWERMVIVAVSWRGAVCVRPSRDMSAPGRWIPKQFVPQRVREVQGNVV